MSSSEKTIGQGSVNLTLNPASQYNAWPLNPYAGQGSVDTSLGIKMIPLTGSIVVLDFARFIPLPSEYDAPGSIGQYNLQIVADVEIPHSMNWWFLRFLRVSSCVKEEVAAATSGC